MATNHDPLPSATAQLNDVLAAYLESAEAHQAPDRQQWLERYPDLATELAAFFANIDRMKQLRQTGGASEATTSLAPPFSNPRTQVPPRVLSDLVGVGQSFGDYELLEEVGRGGMGVVYRARQKSLNRLVALKMIRDGELGDPSGVRRFQAEAEAAARLEHPNIVPIYQVGIHDGRQFLSMKFIEGGSLARQLAGAAIPVRQASRLVETLARAIQAVHERGIVHRDLKPANILLVDGIPQITDFGLAKRMDETEHMTQTGHVVGTASYMAPEQASGRSRAVGPAVDIYALGVILYETLTGRTPFRGATMIETLEAVRSDLPVPPSLLNRKIERDLQTICLKCLEKDPALRYATAQDLADDLRRYLNHQPITARSINVLERLTRTLHESRKEVAFQNWGGIVLLFGVIVLISHVATFLLMRADQPLWLVRGARMICIPLVALVFAYCRDWRLLPANNTERELWTIWLGYLLAYCGNFAVCRLLIASGMSWMGPARVAWSDELVVYPFSAVLSGLAFFIMGSNYWGRCYAFGTAFFALALGLPFMLTWSPLAFGVLWSAILANIGLHLRHLGAEAKKESSGSFAKKGADVDRAEISTSETAHP